VVGAIGHGDLMTSALGPSFLNPQWLISTFGLIGILALWTAVTTDEHGVAAGS